MDRDRSHQPRSRGETHVKIGHRRFYGGVAPIKGVYRGSAGEAEHEVNVTMTHHTS